MLPPQQKKTQDWYHVVPSMAYISNISIPRTLVLRSADPVCAEEAQSASVKGWISELAKCRTALGQIGDVDINLDPPKEEFLYAFIIWLADRRHRIQS